MGIEKKIKGWNPWYPIQTTRSDKDVPFGHFPESYTPASNFWADALAIHCQLYTPWQSWVDPFSAFILPTAGGGFTLASTLAGLASASLVLSEQPVAEWGIGKMYSSPTVGYCIGNLYKENVYFKYSVVRPAAGFNILSYTAGIDVNQRSNIKRIYLHHGNITSSKVNTVDKTVTIDLDYYGVIDKSINYNITGYKVKIIKKSGLENTYPIKSLERNYSIVMNLTDFQDAKFYPTAEDFYEISQPLCLEDPYMISGDWRGIEGAKKTPIWNSGYKLYVTDHIQPYTDGIFTGAYIYVDKETKSPVGIAPNTTFKKNADNEWLWIPSANYASNEIYKSSRIRYYERAFVLPESSVGTTTTTTTATGTADSTTTTTTTSTTTSTNIEEQANEFAEGTEQQVKDYLALPSTVYVRLEISRGGLAQRQNFHAPNLMNCWVKQNGKYYKIVGQPDGNVIDVNIHDISNTAVLDINKSYSILNQYAWMINEHFAYRSSGSANRFIDGTIKTKIYNEAMGTTSVEIDANGNSSGTINQISSVVGISPNNFYTRFASTYKPSTLEPMALWKKYQHWKFITNSGASYDIVPSSVIIPQTTPAIEENFKVIFTVQGNIGNAISGYVVFDTPYELSGNTFFYPLMIKNEIAQGVQDLSTTVVLCVDMEYRSAPMKLDIPTDTIVGVCGGVWWGIQGSGSQDHIMSPNGLNFFMTTRSRDGGLSSFKHRLTEEGWVFYTDPMTRKLSIRKGCIDFRDYPRKTEISIGLSSLTETQEKFPILLNETEERVRSIEFELPSENTRGIGFSTPTDDFKDLALTFQVGYLENYFGIQNTGKGLVDFQALRMAGIGAGVVPSSRYQNSGKYVSPIYLWKKKNGAEYRTKGFLELGLSTSSKNIYVKNYKNPIQPQSITVSYIKENQTLEDMENYDAHMLQDGRVIVVYGMPVPSFKMSNTDVDISKWPSYSGVFAIGTSDDGINWGCPAADLTNNQNIQKPVLLLYGCEYETSFFNYQTQELGIVVKGYHQNQGNVSYQRFYGLFTLSPFKIPRNDFQTCTSRKFDFLFRQTQIPNSIWTNNSSFIPTSEYINLNGTIGFTAIPRDDSFNDGFIRIAGENGTNSFVAAEDLNVISAHVLPNGITIILYSDADGVRLLSYDGCRWSKSKIILARYGSSGFFIGDCLFFIDSDGVKVKNNMYSYILNATEINENTAGQRDVFIELTQSKIDSNKSILISPAVNTMRKLSAFISVSGIYNVFFYDDAGILNCFSSNNQVKWNVGYNY